MKLAEWIEQLPKRAEAHFAAVNRPLFTITYAQSLNGAITARRGEPTVISGDDSMHITHLLRAAHDGILVGVDTVLSDDPRLTARISGREVQNPRPIILDSQLRTPSSARALQHRGALIVTTVSDAMVGCETVTVKDDGHQHVDLVAMSKRLADKGIKSVMIEGGGQIIESFLRAKLADVAIVTIAPKYIDGYVLFSQQSGVTIRLKQVQYESFGDDLIAWGNL